jgi:hypothetical protein
MRRLPVLNPDAEDVQLAGVVPPWIVLPGNLLGRERTVRIAPECVRHIRRRRPAWLGYCLAHIPEVLVARDYIGKRPRGDPRRVEFVRLVGRPSRWLLVAVKILDDRRESWVSSAHPISDENLTRRVRTGTLWMVVREP